MRFFIVEKLFLVKVIFEGLGGNFNIEKKNGYFEYGFDVVIWCYGYMLEFYDLQDYDDKYFNWCYSDLFIKVVYLLKYKIKFELEVQICIILFFIDKVDSIVYLGDFDDEGCLLVDEILGYVGNKKFVQ